MPVKKTEKTEEAVEKKATKARKAPAAKTEVKKTVSKAADAAKKTVKSAAEKAEKAVKAPAKKAKLNVVIQSPMGGEITPEQIAAKLPKEAAEVYVRVDENRLYWVSKDGEAGSVEIWE